MLTNDSYGGNKKKKICTRFERESKSFFFQRISKKLCVRVSVLFIGLIL